MHSLAAFFQWCAYATVCITTKLYWVNLWGNNWQKNEKHVLYAILETRKWENKHLADNSCIKKNNFFKAVAEKDWFEGDILVFVSHPEKKRLTYQYFMR